MEAMAQGYPLAMITYCIKVILIIKWTKAEYPDITKPWYADNTGAMGTSANIELYFNSLKKLSPGFEYFLYISKPFW